MGIKKAKIKYPIREWIGRFESWLLTMKGSGCFRYYDAVLEAFFASFPKAQSLEEITSIEIADWISCKEQRGTDPKTLSMNLYILSSFWKWLIEDRELSLRNPVVAFKRVHSIRGYYISSIRRKISLTDIHRLIDVCTSQEKRIILEVMKGGRPPRGKARQAIQAKAHSLGIKDFSLSSVKMHGRDRLSLDIVQTYCQQLLSALPTEPKSNSNSFTTIELPSSDIRPPICHGDYYLPVVSGVNQQELSPEGQGTVSNSHSESVIRTPISPNCS